MIIREISGEFDSARLLDFDTSFSTKRIYYTFINGMSVEIKEEELASPLHKNYSLDLIKQDIAEADFAVAAEIEKNIVGFAAVKYEKWNNRAVLTAIFVVAKYKGKGIGRALIEKVVEYTKTKSARCLFVETQNVNYPAIRFYRKMNFEFCGFDKSLYNPADVFPNEIALFFCKNLSDENS